ncbi:MAG: TRAP transporter small permease [Saprospiraceae bacterium]|nr:TRAP transporter small permease [Saprospiraceae bacterium]
MKRILKIYTQILKILLTFMMILLIVPVFLQIVSRFVDFIPRYIWTEEIARFAFIWIIMLGATIAVREGTHFSVDMLGNYSPRTENILRQILLIAMLVFSIFFLFGGWIFAQTGLMQHSEIAGLPMIAIYMAWPLAGLSWLFFVCEQLYDHFADQEKTH